MWEEKDQKTKDTLQHRTQTLSDGWWGSQETRVNSVGEPKRKVYWEGEDISYIQYYWKFKILKIRNK